MIVLCCTFMWAINLTINKCECSCTMYNILLLIKESEEAMQWLMFMWQWKGLFKLYRICDQANKLVMIFYWIKSRWNILNPSLNLQSMGSRKDLLRPHYIYSFQLRNAAHLMFESFQSTVPVLSGSIFNTSCEFC